MEALNRAIDGADAFRKMVDKLERPVTTPAAPPQVSQEIAEWNAEVERKKAERAHRRYVKALQR
jgi:hypothetical protein